MKYIQFKFINSKAKFYYTIISLALYIFSGCASIVAPTGGPKDVEPPILVKADPKNLSLSVNRKDFTLVFNELIKIDEEKSELVISPLIEEPKIIIKKNKLIIALTDTLKKNTTYSFNFGSSIQDTRESNALTNFKYVFATGRELDSLKISGKVIDIESGKSLPNTKILLYDELNDSVIYLGKPLSYTIAAEDGTFIFENLHAGEYKLLALLETDNNLKFNSGAEKIGFINYSILLSKDTAGIILNLFKERGLLLKITEKKYANSKLLLKFNNTAKNIKLIYPDPYVDSIGKSFDFNTENDSLIVNFDEEISDSLRVIVSADGMLIDTVFIRIAKKKNLIPTSILFTNNLLNGNLIKPNQALIIELSKLYKTFNKELISLYEDSIKIKEYAIETIDEKRKKIKLIYLWKENAAYELVINKGAFINVQENDSTSLKFKLTSESYFGNLTVKIKKTDSISYLVRIKDDKGLLINQIQVNKDTIIIINTLLPGLYTLSAIKDENRNGKWDTGNYLQKIQPEQILYYKGEIKLRANWDLDINYALPAN